MLNFYNATNYEQGTIVRVDQAGRGDQFIVSLIDLDTMQLVGVRKYCPSAERAACEYAQRVFEGKPLPGELSPML